MPFRSKAQARYLFANHPKMAREWADETSDMKALPEKKGYSLGSKGEKPRKVSRKYELGGRRP